MSNPTVLSYYDICLKASDVKLLEEPNWLNDQIISLLFEYFNQEKFKNLTEQIYFLGPEVVQLIKFTDATELELLFEPLSLKNKQLVIIPINDNMTQDTTGGTHWSILSFNRQLPTKFQHYDSAPGCGNSEVARLIAKRVLPLLEDESPSEIAANCVVQEAGHCPRQRNGYDCGVFAILIAEHIADAFAHNVQQNSAPPNFGLADIDQALASAKRTEWKRLITTLSSVTSDPRS